MKPVERERERLSCTLPIIKLKGGSSHRRRDCAKATGEHTRQRQVLAVVQVAVGAVAADFLQHPPRRRLQQVRYGFN